MISKSKNNISVNNSERKISGGGGYYKYNSEFVCGKLAVSFY